jgi:hypothetical protein
MAIPDAQRLKKAAAVTLVAELAADGIPASGTGQGASDPALTRARGEPPLDAAVDLVNQARYLQDGIGPCAGCYGPADVFDHGSHPGGPGEEPDLHLPPPPE